MSSTTDAPAPFICPISNEVMTDPVVDPEGNTFERAAIERWLRTNPTSPITRRPLSSSDLAPNRSLRDAIEAWKAGGATLPVAPPAVAVPVADATAAIAGGSELDVKVNAFHDPRSGDVVISVTPPTSPASAPEPLDVVCVVDVSGSMGETASVQNEKGTRENHGLSVLDVVKHAVRTIANLLGSNDRLAIVAFSNDAKVTLQLTAMGAAGVAKVHAALDAMQPLARTNLYDGLQTAMDLLKNRTGAGATARNAAIMLLTDGQPNINPPRGIVPTLKRYLDAFPGGVPPFSVCTYGFGYDLDSALLNEIASVGSSGLYVFIPDSGLVGTVFINSLASLQATCASSVSVSVDTNGNEVVVLGPHLMKTSTGANGSIGTLQYGQTRHVCFRVGGDVSKDVVVQVEFAHRGVTRSITVNSTPITSPEQQSILVACRARNAFVEGVLTAAVTHDATAVDTLIATLESLGAGETALGKALLEDVRGEVKLAVTDPAAFKKWGQHYLPSLAKANLLEQRNNFKDKSVQQYGGAFFEKLCDQGEAVFLKIPPPKPSNAPVPQPMPPTWVGGVGYGATRAAACSAAPTPAPTHSMAAYYNVRGGCVVGDCLVALAGGVEKPAASVARGDVLADGAIVRARVAIRTGAEPLPLVRFSGGLAITEFHPIKLPGGEWAFPVDAALVVPGAKRVTEANHEFVYTFVLEDGTSATRTLLIGGIEVVALGHGLRGDAVVEHEYLGSRAVLDDISRLQGFAEGAQVIVDAFVRDSVTNRVCGIVGVEAEARIP